MQSFICKKCSKKSKVKGIEQNDGKAFVVCEHCSEKNKLHQLPTCLGAPLQFEIISLIEDDH